MMPYTIDNPPNIIKDLTKEEQQLWIKVFNETLERTKRESAAFKSAWGVINKNKNQANLYVAKPDFNSKRLKRLGEDEHFVQFPVILTRVGVMNGAYKSPEELTKMFEHLKTREYLPSMNDHPSIKDPEFVNPDKHMCGYVSNFELRFEDNNPNKGYIEGVDHVPKSRVDLIDMLESGKQRNGSLGFRAHTNDNNGLWNGYNYNRTEHNMMPLHWARLLNASPACPPTWQDGSTGCGYVNEDKKNKEGNDMPDNDNEDTKEKKNEDKATETKTDETKELLINQQKQINELKEALEEANKVNKDNEERLKAYDEILKNEHDELVKKVNEFDPEHKLFKEDEVKEMKSNELKNIVKLIEAKNDSESDQKPPAKPLPTSSSGNGKYDPEAELRKNNEELVWVYDPEKGEKVQKKRTEI